MALGDTYATLNELKSYLALTTTVELDEQMADALNSSSREIERYCNRQFNKTATATARVFPPTTCSTAWVDDFHTITDLVIKSDDTGDGVFETTWDSSDYELYPYNGVLEGQAGWPYYKISAVGNAWFPMNRFGRMATLQVTAQWGWSDIPAPVKQACLILSAMNFQLKDAPLGVAGMGEFGVIRVQNSRMAMDKLSKFCRSKVLVG